MAEVHVALKNPDVVFHNPGQHPLPSGAGQPVAQQKDASGKVVKTVGQVSGTSIVHQNPA